MRVIISLILCSAILITGSSINGSITDEKKSIGHGLTGNIEQEKLSGVERQVRENRNKTDDALPESRQDEDIDTQKISAPATTGKREVSTASASASTSTISNIDQSAFESKTNDIFSNILAEMRALMESAKLALLNLKSELSFGPQIGETYDENAAAESESLTITQNEISSFMEHFPVLVQTLIEEPHQIWTVQDMVTASVPTDQISGSVGRLRNHIVELLEVLRARLAANPQSSNSVQTLEQYIASLQAQRFQVLDDLVARDDSNRDYASSSATASANAYSSASSSSASSSAVSYANSQQTAESEERTEISETPENDSIITRKIKSLRALCAAIKRIPSLLIELPFALKEGLSSLHTNEGLCQKLKNHPIFSIPCLRALLPKGEETPEGTTEVQSTSVTSTSSSSSSASSVAQNVPDVARAIISPWLQSPSASAASSSSDFEYGNRPEGGAITSAVARASAVAQTLPDRARSMISPFVQRSEASSSASSSATSSNSFNFGDGRVPEVINSAVASASSAAQTLPDTARSVISPLIQKFHDSGSSNAASAGSSRSAYGSNSEAFSSATARATSMTETSVNSPSFVSRTNQQKPCPICGLFSCLCHKKGQGHNFHPFGKPASEDEFSRPSSSYTSSSASSSSASASASSSNSFDRPSSQQKPCPKCGLFSCLCHKGPGHGIHSLLKPSSEDDQSYLVPIPSAAYASSRASADSSSRTSPQQKPCPICGLFSCLGHHKGHGHDIHPLLRPSENEFSRSSSSYTSSRTSAEPCPKCGLFSCLCNKEHGHNLHPFKKPSSGDDRSYLVPIPSENYASSRTSAASISDTTSIIQPSIQRTPQQKPCPICGLFSCLCHKKEHGHNLHPFKKPSSEDDRSYLVPIPSENYASSSTSAASSSRTSEEEYISPAMTIPRGNTASSSSSSASASSSDSFDRSGCDEELRSRQFSSASAAASARSFSDTTSIIQPSIQRTPQRKACPICGLFSCLGHHKGHGHNLHPFRKPASEDEFSRPSSSYSSSSASASSSSSFDRPSSQQKPCPKCGLLSCLCNKGHSVHPFKRPSSENDRSYLVPISSATYASSSASAAASSRISEEDYISPAMTVSDRNSASSSSSSASTSSSNTFDRPDCNDDLRSRQFSSASAAASASARSFSDTTSIIQPSIQRTPQRKACPICGLFSCLGHHKGNGHSFHPFRKPSSGDDRPYLVPIPGTSYTSSSTSSASSSSTSEEDYISPEIPIPVEKMATSSSSSASASSLASFDQSNCDDLRSNQFTSASAAASARSFSDTASIIQPSIQRSQDSSSASSTATSTSSVSTSLSPSSPKVSPNEEPNHGGHGLTSLIGKVKSSCPLSIHKHRSHPLLEKCSKCGLLSCLHKNKAQNSDNSGQSYSPVPVTRSDSMSTSSALSSSSSQEQVLNPVRCSPSVPSTSLRPSPQELQFSPKIRIPNGNSRSSELSPSPGAYSSSSEFYPSSIPRNSASAAATATSQIRNPTFASNYPRPNQNVARRPSFRPESSINRKTPSISSYIPDFSRNVPNYDESSRSSPESSNVKNPSFYSYIPNLSSLVPNFNSGSSMPLGRRPVSAGSSGSRRPSTPNALGTPRTSQESPSLGSRNLGSLPVDDEANNRDRTNFNGPARNNGDNYRDRINSNRPAENEENNRDRTNFNRPATNNGDSYRDRINSNRPAANDENNRDRTNSNRPPSNNRDNYRDSINSNRPAANDANNRDRTNYDGLPANNEGENRNRFNSNRPSSNNEDNNRDRTNFNGPATNNGDNYRDRINSNRPVANDENNRDRTNFDRLPANNEGENRNRINSNRPAENDENNRDRTNSNRPAALSPTFRTGSSSSDDYYLNDAPKNSPNSPSAAADNRKPSISLDTSETSQGGLNTGSRNSPLLAAEDDENGLLRPATYDYKRLPNSDKFAVSPKASGDESSRYHGYDHNEDDNQSANSRFSPSFSQGIRGSGSGNSQLLSANGGGASRDNVLRPATYGFEQLPNSDRFAASPPASVGGSSHYGGYDLHDELNEAEQRY